MGNGSENPSEGRRGNGSDARSEPGRRFNPRIHRDAPVRPWVATPSSGSARYERASREAAAFSEEVLASLENHRAVTLGDVLQLLHWSTLHDAAEEPKRAASDELLMRVRRAFHTQAHPDCKLALYPSGAVFLESPGARLQVVWLGQRFSFDMTDARALVDRVEAISDVAHNWWPDERTLAAGGAQSRLRRLAASWRASRRDARSPAEERDPHIERAYAIATTALAAVAAENERPRPADTAEEPSVSEDYRRTLAQAHERAARAEEVLDTAGQRTAQARYGRGMVLGIVGLAILTLPLAAALMLSGFELTYAVAVGAGGVGAVMSVLQRMTSSRLRLDLEGASLQALGVARPLVGAIFGVLVVALLESGLLDFAPADGSHIALAAVLAFFAGFNERFAQDALSSSVAGPVSSAVPAR